MTVSTQHSSRHAHTDATTIWHIISSNVFPRSHGSYYLWPPKSSSKPEWHSGIGANANYHLQNLRALFRCLQEKGLWCTLENVTLHKPSMEPRSHSPTTGSIKESKVDARGKIPPTADITGPISFLALPNFMGNSFLTCPRLWRNYKYSTYPNANNFRIDRSQESHQQA